MILGVTRNTGADTDYRRKRKRCPEMKLGGCACCHATSAMERGSGVVRDERTRESNLTAKGTFVKRSHVGDFTVVESFVTFDGELIEPEAMTCYVNGEEVPTSECPRCQ